MNTMTLYGKVQITKLMKSYYKKRKRRWELKRQLPPSIHLPNKAESKMLRKLMADNKMSKSQIRMIPKFRKMLSDAQDKGEQPIQFDETRNIYISKQ